MNQKSWILNKWIWLYLSYLCHPHLKSICFSCRVTIATSGGLPVLSMCSSTLDAMICVVISASAATPAPQQLQNILEFFKYVKSKMNTFLKRDNSLSIILPGLKPATHCATLVLPWWKTWRYLWLWLQNSGPELHRGVHKSFFASPSQVSSLWGSSPSQVSSLSPTLNQIKIL